jgi:hypothetical protein
MERGTGASYGEYYSQTAVGSSKPHDNQVNNCNANGATRASVTLFTSENEALGKRFTLKSGSIHKQTLGTLTRGTAKTVSADRAADLASLLDGLSHKQAISIGQLSAGDFTRITTQAQKRPGAITRSKANFQFQHGPGWLLLDYDDKGQPDHVAARIAEMGGPVAAWECIWPALRTATRVIRPSSSDGVSAPGCGTLHSSGVHCFVRVDDVAQAKDALQALQVRAWAAGLAWFYLSKAGALLERSIVDVSVGSPERLVFEAPPILQAPVIRNARKSMAAEGATLSTPKVDPDTIACAAQAMADAREQIAPKAKQVEADFSEGQAKKVAAAQSIPLPEARAIVRKRIDGQVLADNDIIDGPDGRALRIGDLLDRNPYRLGLPDPLEGIAYGRDKATYLGGTPDFPEPKIRSHAHGLQTVYRFARFQGGPEDGAKKQKAYHPEYGVSHKKGPGLHQKAVLDWGQQAIAYANLRSDTAPRMLLSGAQGVGKTRAVLEVATSAVGLITVIYVPTRDKVEEAVNDLLAIQTETSPRIMPIFGRSAKPSWALDPMCRISDAAAKVSAGGGNPRRSLCPSCPFRENCNYLLQEHKAQREAEDPRGAVFVVSHGYLGAKIPGDVTPDLAVVDEAPTGLIPNSETCLKVSDLGVGLQVNTKKVDAVADAMHDLLMIIKPFAVAIGRAFTDAPGQELTHLRERGFDLEAARNAREALAQFTDNTANAKAETAAKEASFAGGNPEDFAQRIERAIEGCVSPAARRHVHLFEAVIDAMERGEGTTPAIWSALMKGKTDDGQEVEQPGLAVATLQKALISKSVPLLQLDGTAHIDLPHATLGEMDHVAIPVEPDALVIQVHSPPFDGKRQGRSFSNQSITGVRADGLPLSAPKQKAALELREAIGRIVAMQAKPFVFGNKGVMAAMEPQLPPGCQTSHYGAVRAVNTFEDCQTGIGLGRQLPTVKAVEVQARAIAAALGRKFEPLPNGEWPRQIRGIRMRDGSVVQTETEYHPDPTADMVLQQIREADLMQGLYRVRPIFNRRVLIILSSVALDITVDQVLTLKELEAGGTRVQRLLQSGVILGSQSETVRCYPEIWSNKKALQRDLKALEVIKPLGGHFTKDILLGKCPPNSDVALVEYQRARPVGTRGAPPAMVRAFVIATPEHVRAKLEARTGPLAQFAVIEAFTVNPMSEEAEEAEAIKWADGIPHDVPAHDGKRPAIPKPAYQPPSQAPPPAPGSGEWIAAINLDTRR